MRRYKKGIVRDIFDVVLVIFFLVFLLAAFDAESAEPIPHPWDYASHAIGGAVVVELADADTVAEAALYSGAVGVAKELTDRNFDTADALAWVVGGVLYQQYRISVRTSGDAVVVGGKVDF